MSNGPTLDALLSTVSPRCPPNWTTRYRIGALLSKDMEVFCTLEELGAELGITKQNAYTESVLALGTLVCHLYVRTHFRRARPSPRNK